MAICAAGEVDATLKALRDSPKTASAKAKFILATDDERYRRKTSPSDDPPIACEHAAPPFLILRGVDAKERIGQIQRQYEFSTK